MRRSPLRSFCATLRTGPLSHLMAPARPPGHGTRVVVCVCVGGMLGRGPERGLGGAYGGG